MPARAKVLVVGHDASRTGAPLALLEVVRWLAESRSFDLRLSLLSGGPLLDAFATSVPTSVAPRAAASATRVLDAAAGSERLTPAVAEPLGRALGLVAARGSGRPRADVVLANTLAAWPAAVAVASGAPVICWVHELDGVADRLVAASRRPALIARTPLFIATGARVATMLTDRWAIPSDRIVVVSAPVLHPPGGVRAESTATLPRLQVVGVGAAIARKGLDAFVATAALLAASHSGTCFRWVGAAPGARATVEAQADIAAADLGEIVAIDAPCDDLEPTWRHARLLLHTAREDADPRVVVEAARQGVAVVTWDTGGAADLLRRAGLGSLVADAGDVMGLARRAGALLDDPELALATASVLARAATDHDVEVAGPAIAAGLNHALRGRGGHQGRIGPTVSAGPTSGFLGQRSEP